MENKSEPYQLNHKVRIVTATSLFDGHDAAINIMRRLMQRSGAEVIHLGHNRSVHEIVHTALQEDVQAIAITSYQGGHLEFFKYMKDLLKKHGLDHIKIFGGGGGTILVDEINELHSYGISRIYTPDDGRKMGLQGMINDLLSICDFDLFQTKNGTPAGDRQLSDFKTIARYITMVENESEKPANRIASVSKSLKSIPVIGITGTGGAGKSSLVDEMISRFTMVLPDLRIAILSVDPSKRKSGGALLGDRIRMNAIYQNPNVFMRSMATRQPNMSVSRYIPGALKVLKSSDFDLIILETSGIGQADTSIVDFSELTIYVMTPEFGAPTQLEKIDMLDFADIIAINKFDKRGSKDAWKAVCKQYRRNHQKWDEPEESMPVVGTIASQFNDSGIHTLFNLLLKLLSEKCQTNWKKKKAFEKGFIKKPEIIPPNRIRYLSEIAESIKNYNEWVDNQSEIARKLYSIDQVKELFDEGGDLNGLMLKKESLGKRLEVENRSILDGWKNKIESYRKQSFPYTVRGKILEVSTSFTSLSHTKLSRVSLPGYHDWGDILKWSLKENVPGEFPFTAGVFPFKRDTEEPTRMFAGEGGPERTNKRFHYLAEGMPAKRLSTAFDSVTLYGEDPDQRPDIYGKIGNSGVSVCSLDDAKRLYSGFDLCDPMTSVSMTINGPAAVICAFLMNAAIDQQCEKYIRQNSLQKIVEKQLIKKYDDKGLPRPEYDYDIPAGHDELGLMLLGLTGDQILERPVYEKIKSDTLQKVRGTVQADILKEDQAQNTCIFSTEFSLRIMGDMQSYFYFRLSYRRSRSKSNNTVGIYFG
jgi:methylmalonyl-CoA mutase